MKQQQCQQLAHSPPGHAAQTTLDSVWMAHTAQHTSPRRLGWRGSCHPDLCNCNGSVRAVGGQSGDMWRSAGQQAALHTTCAHRAREGGKSWEQQHALLHTHQQSAATTCRGERRKCSADVRTSQRRVSCCARSVLAKRTLLRATHLPCPASTRRQQHPKQLCRQQPGLTRSTPWSASRATVCIHPGLPHSSSSASAQPAPSRGL